MKAVKEIVKKYYKYKGISWKQPILTANGTMGGNSFAVSASTEFNSNYLAYKAFDNSTSTDWATAGTHIPSWITFYNPRPLKVSLLTLRNRHYADNTGEVFLAGNIYGSNDNSNWDLLTPFTNSVIEKDNVWTIDLSNNTSFYKYYKIEGTSFNGTNQGFSNIIITAVEQVPSNIPSTYRCLGSITGGRFDSNIQMTYNTSVESESALVANDTNWRYLIDNDSPVGSWFIVGKEQTNTPFTRHFLSSYGSLGVNPTVNQFYHFFINMSATTKYFYIDDYLGYSTSNSSTGNLGGTLLLNHNKYKSKYFKTYNGNMELEHYIIPVKRIADDKLGWYDAIDDIFYSDSWLEPVTAYEKLEYEEGTPSDYDFYEDVEVYKAVKEKIRKYYKYKTSASGYRQLTYIQSDGNQYIDLGISLGSAIMEVNLDVQYISGNNSYFVGAGYDLGSAGRGIGFGVRDSKYLVIEPGSNWNQFGTVTTDRTQFKWVINGNTSTLTGYASNTVTSSSHFGTSCAWRNYNLTLFKSSNDSPISCKMYSSDLLINDIKVRNLIPHERLFDNAIGLYDTENDVFYTNSGSGSFIKGDYIIEESTSSDYDFYEDVDVYKAVKF